MRNRYLLAFAILVSVLVYDKVWASNINSRLLSAAEKGEPVIAQYLINCGADVNTQDNDGATPLILAACAGDSGVVEVLLNNGAEVNMSEMGGNTALMMAAFFGDIDIVEILLSAGADIDAVAKDGETALSLAESEGHEDIVTILLNIESYVNEEDYNDSPVTMEIKSVSKDQRKAPTIQVSSDNYTNKEMIVESKKQLLRQRLTNTELPQGADDIKAIKAVQDLFVIKCLPAPSTESDGLTWDGNLWVSSDISFDDINNKIYKLNPEDGQVLDWFYSPGPGPHDLAFDGQYLWNVDFLTEKIYQIDPNTKATIRSIPAPAGITSGLTWDGNTLWVSEWLNDNVIYQIDPLDGTVLKSFPAPDNEASLSGLAWDGAYLWFSSPLKAGIYKLDPNNGDILEFFSYLNTAQGLTYDDLSLWNNTSSNEICQLDLSGTESSYSDKGSFAQSPGFGVTSSGACSLSDHAEESFSSVITNILVLFSPLFLLRKRNNKTLLS